MGSKAAAHALCVAVRCGFLLCIVATFPMQMWPFRGAIWSLFSKEVCAPRASQRAMPGACLGFCAGSLFRVLCWDLCMAEGCAGPPSGHKPGSVCQLCAESL
jgi:hypothetical protein